MVDRESESTGVSEQQVAAALDFGDALAIAANQKLRARAMTRSGAGNERVATLDSMNQPRREEVIKGTINDRRRQPLVTRRTVEFGQDVVGTHRLVTGEHDFENLSPAFRQAQLARFAEIGGRGQALALAATVIVLAKRDRGGMRLARHNVIL